MLFLAPVAIRVRLVGEVLLVVGEVLLVVSVLVELVVLVALELLVVLVMDFAPGVDLYAVYPALLLRRHRVLRGLQAGGER